MKNLIVLFGGKSAEHDISLITANLALNALDEQKYNIFPIFIDKLNHWFWAKNFKNNIALMICKRYSQCCGPPRVIQYKGCPCKD